MSPPSTIPVAARTRLTLTLALALALTLTLTLTLLLTRWRRGQGGEEGGAPHPAEQEGEEPQQAQVLKEQKEVE